MSSTVISFGSASTRFTRTSATSSGSSHDDMPGLWTSSGKSRLSVVVGLVPSPFKRAITHVQESAGQARWV